MAFRSSIYVIATLAFFTSPVFAQDSIKNLDYDLLLKHYFFQKPDFLNADGALDDYALYSSCKEYKQQHMLNEFEKRKFTKELQTSLGEWKTHLSDGAELPKTFKIKMVSDFGKFDFDTQKFSFKPFTAETFLPVVKERGRSVFDCRSIHETWPNAFDVIFINGPMFDGLSMSEDNAAKVNLSLGRQASLDITAEIVGVNLESKEGKNARPQIKAKITEMSVTQVSRKGSPLALLSKFDAATVSTMNADWEEKEKSMPMPLTIESFVAWADHLGVKDLAGQYGIDVSSIALKPIGFDNKYASLDYSRGSGYAPKSINEDGTASMGLSWDGSKVPEALSMEGQIGVIVFEFTNVNDYRAEHKAAPDMVEFLSHASRPALKADLSFLPETVEKVVSSYGDTEWHFKGKISSMTYTAMDTATNKMHSVVFDSSTMVTE